MTGETALVTGVTGFVAQHCVAELLRQGYTVRGSVRRVERADDVRRALVRAGVDPSALAFTVANLDSDDGWDAAIAGCRFVLHVASPFPMIQPKDREDLFRPARDGTRRVLAAATRSGVARVVVTSSTAAIMYPAGRPADHIHSEIDWTDPGRPSVTAYIASKALAERAAWDFVRTTPGAPELVAINPGFVQGPALSPDLSTSLEVLKLMARGIYPASPRVVLPVVDVRDVAALHVAALTHPQVAGQRFLAAEGSLSLFELGRFLAAACPDLATKVPKFELPDWVARALSPFDSRLRSILPELGRPRHFSNAKACKTFGYTFRKPREAVSAAAQSLRELGVI